MNLTLLDNYTKILITSKQVEKNKQILDLEEKNLEITLLNSTNIIAVFE